MKTFGDWLTEICLMLMGLAFTTLIVSLLLRLVWALWS